MDYVPYERIHKFSCGHIVPQSSILTIAVSQGPSTVPFDFTFESRASNALVLVEVKFQQRY